MTRQTTSSTKPFSVTSLSPQLESDRRSGENRLQIVGEHRASKRAGRRAESTGDDGIAGRRPRVQASIGEPVNALSASVAEGR